MISTFPSFSVFWKEVPTVHRDWSKIKSPIAGINIQQILSLDICACLMMSLIKTFDVSFHSRSIMFIYANLHIHPYWYRILYIKDSLQHVRQYASRLRLPASSHPGTGQFLAHFNRKIIPFKKFADFWRKMSFSTLICSQSSLKHSYTYLMAYY